MEEDSLEETSLEGAQYMIFIFQYFNIFCPLFREQHIFYSNSLNSQHIAFQCLSDQEFVFLYGLVFVFKFRLKFSDDGD